MRTVLLAGRSETVTAVSVASAFDDAPPSTVAADMSKPSGSATDRFTSAFDTLLRPARRVTMQARS